MINIAIFDTDNNAVTDTYNDMLADDKGHDMASFIACNLKEHPEILESWFGACDPPSPKKNAALAAYIIQYFKEHPHLKSSGAPAMKIVIVPG